MAHLGARGAGLVAVLTLSLAACGGRATAPRDGGPEDAAGDAAGDAGPLCNRDLHPGCTGSGEVCDLHGCAFDGGGRCVLRPVSCSEIWAPVCGCDGLTYDNDCRRLQAGAAWRAAGECQVDAGGGDCLDSDLEPNDTPQTATNLDGTLAGHPQGVSLYGLEVCAAGDLDYYSFTVTAAKHAIVLVQFQRSAGELAASLLDPSLAVHVQGTPTAGGLQLEADLEPQASPYYLLVQPGPGGTLNRYDFSLSFSTL